MFNTEKAKWNLSNSEKYAINWFEQNGFSGYIVKQYISKTVFKIEKNGISDTFELAQGVKNINTKKLMNQYNKVFNMLYELRSANKNFI